MSESQIWTKSIPNSEIISVAPVIAGNVIVFVTQDEMGHDFVYGMSLYDGLVRWKHRSSHDIKELVTRNGTVFFVGHSSDFFNDPEGKRPKSDPVDVPTIIDVDPYIDDVAVSFAGLLAIDVGSGRLKSDW